MVSAPATYWMSVQGRSASRRASPAAASPYSTKLRPHFPHGCIPAPTTATRLSSGTGLLLSDRVGSSVRGPTGPIALGLAVLVPRPPLPHQVLVVIVLV